MKIGFLILVLTCCWSCCAAQIEQDARHHSDVGVSYFLNTKYLHSNLRYYYKSPLVLKHFHVRFEGEAFQLSSQSPLFLLGNYNKFHLIGDVNIPLSNNWSMFPFVGLQLAIDLTHIKQQPSFDGRAGVAGIVGVEWMATKGRFIFQLMSRWTIYRNGIWKEIRPQIGLDIWKGVSANIGLNLAVAIASTGFDAAIYPHIGINYFIPLPSKED